MRSFSRYLPKPLAFLELALVALLAVFASDALAQTPNSRPGGRIVLVLPFENRSGNPSLNWIGDSFPDTLDRRLTSAGFLTISHDDRVFAYDHLGLPADFRPTRATTIRIAQQLDANFVIVGNYTVNANAGEAGGERIAIQARVLSIDNLTLSPPVQDSAELSRLYDVENAIAWKVARVLDPGFSLTEQSFLSASGAAVPLPAFEDYIRGVSSIAPSERLKRLQTAVSLAPNYPVALLALGKEQYAERDFDGAAATLAKVPQTDRLALEANFYIGLARFNSANYAAAEQAFAFVASKLPLPEVVNDKGVALSRQGKDGVAFYEQATQADPSDEDYHYNLAVALFRRGDTSGAQQQVNEALKLKPKDNEAIDLNTELKSVPAGTKLTADMANGFAPVERIRRNYSEASYRQAAFQLDQLRAMRMAMLQPTQRAIEYTQLGREYIKQGLFPEAETQIANALSADPKSADARAALAELREASHNPAEARQEAHNSLTLKPNVAALLVLAQLDLNDQQLKAAADDVSAALHIDPHDSRAIAMKLVLQQRGQAVQ